MKTALQLVTVLFIVATAAHAQVTPEATASTAQLHYSARYAQNSDFLGSSLGDSQDAILSGTLAYTNGVKRLPFALTYGGGYSWNLAGIAYDNGLFENVMFSQGIVGRSWNIQASDNVSYRKTAPTTGFSGVPGTGEPVGEPNPPPSSSQTILTLNTRTVNNIVSGEFEHSLNYSTALSVGGSSELLRYPDGDGLDTDGQTMNALLTRRLTARNSLSGQYLFSEFSYPGNNLAQATSSFVTNSALFGYQREWNRRITTNASIGPQWIGSSNSAVVPFSTTVSGSAKIDDQFRFGSASLDYSHAASGGSGFLLGAEVDSVSADFSRDFERKLTMGLTGGYRRTSSLDNEGEINGKFGSAMATLRLSPTLTAFANYTAMDQSTSYALPANALTSLQQVMSFGIAYSPRGKRLNTQ
ncbi:MAG: hypothetical protein WBE03_12355 [Terracidiphilus sp.]